MFSKGGWLNACDSKLRTFGILRSNDMENAYPSNYYDLLMLSHRVSEELGVPMGRITTFSISAHVYLWRSEKFLVERSKNSA